MGLRLVRRRSGWLMALPMALPIRLPIRLPMALPMALPMDLRLAPRCSGWPMAQ